jgi:hypothetical protein
MKIIDNGAFELMIGACAICVGLNTSDDTVALAGYIIVVAGRIIGALK